MTLNKKILAAAIVGGLFATAAQAQVTISATTPVPATFASELVIPGSGSLTLTNAANALDLVTALRYSFSATEVRYARIECPSNIRFSAGSAVTASSAAALGAINGLGTNVITFSITATDASTTATSTVTVSGNRAITSTTAGACSYSLYDEPSQAIAGGTAGRITTVTGNYIAFARSYELDVTPAGAVANVEADPAFSRFVSATPTNSVDRAQLGEVLFDTRANVLGLAQPRLANGVAATLGDLLSADSAHVIDGDFSAAANANGSFSGAALNRVYFSLNANCSTVDIPADAVTATSATFELGATAVNTAFLCYAPRTTVAIPVSGYTQTFVADSTDATLYAPTNRGPAAHGDITRNGTQLQAPLAQVPAGYLSRVALTNTGTLARPYTITVFGETGNTIGTANLTGSVPASGTTVIDLNTVMTSFTGASRGTINVTIAGPNAQIQGLYQIVNPATGSISNHVMVRPGTN